MLLIAFPRSVFTEKNREQIVQLSISRVVILDPKTKIFCKLGADFRLSTILFHSVDKCNCKKLAFSMTP